MTVFESLMMMFAYAALIVSILSEKRK